MRLLSILLLTACGSSGNPADDGGGDLAMNGGGGDLAMSGGGGDLATAYPAGPYGNTVGATFPPLVWEGYVAGDGSVVVNTLPFGPYSADDARKSGKPYAMIHVSEFF